MPSFKEMNPETIRAILEERDANGQPVHRDVLTPLVEKEDLHFGSQSCPKCGTYACRGVVDARRPFSPGNPLPNKIARCSSCGTEFDPHTRVILRASIIDG